MDSSTFPGPYSGMVRAAIPRCWPQGTHKAGAREAPARQEHGTFAWFDCSLPCSPLVDLIRLLPNRPGGGIIDSARDFLGELRQIRQTVRKLLAKLLIAVNQRSILVRLQEPFPVFAFPRECGRNPVGQRRWDNLDRLRGLGLFADDQQHLGALSFPWRAKSFDLAHGDRIEMKMVDQRRNVSGLL